MLNTHVYNLYNDINQRKNRPFVVKQNPGDPEPQI